MADLWESISRRDLPSARTYLERGADVNYSEGGKSCLMWAVSRRNKELVSLLLQQPGIDVNVSDDDGETALHKAAGCLGTPALIRLLLDFPGIDMEAQNNNGFTPLMFSILLGTSAQFAELLKTPEILLNEVQIPTLLEEKPEMQKMFANEQRKREEYARKENERQEKVKREEKNKKKGQKRKRKVCNEAEKWKKVRLARRRQKEAVEEVMRKNKEAEEEMSKEGRVSKEKVEKEFQDKIDALAREIKVMEDEKQKRLFQMDQELVERQMILSKTNQDELNNLTKKHKVENADMVEEILDNEDKEDDEDEDEEAAPQAPAAPDCPICYELMSPPTRIFQCGAGHLVCGTCRPRLQVGSLYIFLVSCILGGKCFIQAKFISKFNCNFQECPSRCGQPMLGPAIGLEHFVGKIWNPMDSA